MATQAGLVIQKWVLAAVREARSERRPGVALASLRRMAHYGLLVLFGVQLALYTGCNTGSRNEFMQGPPPPPTGVPRIESMSPQFGCGGDVVTIIGQNFSLVPSENIVTFRSNDGSGTEFTGEVLTVTATGPVGPNTPATMSVRVPTAVRNSTVELDVVVGGQLLDAFGTADFCGCPVVIGAVYGNDNDGVASANIASVITTTVITVYGYNVRLINSATIIDEDSNLVMATVTPGVPAGANFAIPPTMEAATITVPNGIVIDECDESGLLTLRFSAPCTVDGSALAGNDFPLMVQKSPGGASGLVPATISGVLLPAGVRSGLIDVQFSLLSAPASELWDVTIEYEDGSGTGIWNPATIVGEPTPGLVENLVCGIPLHQSTVGGIVGPGHVHKVTWDSAMDLPMEGNTRLRLTPTPAGASNFLCDPTRLTTESLAYNNTSIVGGMGASSIVEDFSTTARFDATAMLDFPTADWDVGAGVLRGTGAVQGTESPFGTGMIDVVLSGDRMYEINTDIPEIIDVTNLGMPITILGGPSAPNPGDPMNEFHCRTFFWEAPGPNNPDNVMLAGDLPLVIRCSGTGDVTEIASRLDGSINLDGADGTEGTQTAIGTGGMGILGGGNGGDGGQVDTNPMAQEITNLVQPGDGANGGGRGGQSTSYATQNGSSSPRPGPGGGGGHATAGEAGRNQNTNQPTSMPGDGGPARGDATLAFRTTGSGGGGGGGASFRVSGNSQLQARFGGGGGAGGGGFDIYVNGTIAITGNITANGGDGKRGTPGINAGGGGGGSGGMIAIRAEGGIALASDNLLLARGGEGDGQSEDFRGGHGADGRIRLESNGGISYGGLNDFTNVQPTVGSNGVSVGVASGTIPVGAGVDGSLDLSIAAFPPGEYLLNTGPNMIPGFPPPGQINSPTGTPVLNNPAASGTGTFEFTVLNIPAGYTLRAFGDNPLVIGVQTDAIIEGTISVSGTNGGIPDFPMAGTPTPGSGGIAGAGGGAGGLGGVSDGATTNNGADGTLPPGLPPELNGTLPPIGSPGPAGNPVPINPATPAIGGQSVATGVAGSAGGGGYANNGVAGGQETGGAPANGTHGDGGSRFGNNSFVGPSGAPLIVGGPGGGAGGAGLNSPGSGGGGGGGYLEMNVGGLFRVAASAEILARGGNAYRAAVEGGNGGGGAGGAIVLRGRGLTQFEAPGPVVSVTGGMPNLDPTMDATLMGMVSYTPNTDLNGGSGSSGRIRVESPVGFNTTTPAPCPVTIPDVDPTDGVCPAPSVGLLLRSGTGISEAQTTSYPVSIGGSAVLVSGAVFAAPTITPNPTSGAPTVQVFYRGATDNFDLPGTLTPFSGWSQDPGSIEGASVIQKLFRLFGSANQVGGTAQPTVDMIDTPFTF